MDIDSLTFCIRQGNNNKFNIKFINQKKNKPKSLEREDLKLKIAISK